MLLGQSNLARLLVVSLAILVVGQVFLPPVDAAFELACMEKCLKTRRCKKYGQISLDYDCDKQCKKKCYKVLRSVINNDSLLDLLSNAVIHLQIKT